VESQFKQGLEALKLSVATIKDKQALKILWPPKLNLRIGQVVDE
jgi:hypothetical protein